MKNLESGLTFSERSFNFLQNNLIFWELYPRRYTAGDSVLYSSRLHCQRLTELKGLSVLKVFLPLNKTSLRTSFTSIPIENKLKTLHILQPPSKNIQPLYLIIYYFTKTLVSSLNNSMNIQVLHSVAFLVLHILDINKINTLQLERIILFAEIFACI